MVCWMTKELFLPPKEDEADDYATESTSCTSGLLGQLACCSRFPKTPKGVEMSKRHVKKLGMTNTLLAIFILQLHEVIKAASITRDQAAAV